MDSTDYTVTFRSVSRAEDVRVFSCDERGVVLRDDPDFDAGSYCECLGLEAEGRMRRVSDAPLSKFNPENFRSRPRSE